MWLSTSLPKKNACRRILGVAIIAKCKGPFFPTMNHQSPELQILLHCLMAQLIKLNTLVHFSIIYSNFWFHFNPLHFEFRPYQNCSWLLPCQPLSHSGTFKHLLLWPQYSALSYAVRPEGRNRVGLFSAFKFHVLVCASCQICTMKAVNQACMLSSSHSLHFQAIDPKRRTGRILAEQIKTTSFLSSFVHQEMKDKDPGAWEPGWLQVTCATDSETTAPMGWFLPLWSHCNWSPSDSILAN